MKTQKQATKIGIGRALASARIQKSTYQASSMVRGYGTVSNGYELSAADGNIYIRYYMKDFATISLTSEQIAQKRRDADAILRLRLMEIEQILRAKGFDASATFNAQITGKKLDGIVTVRNAKVGA